MATELAPIRGIPPALHRAEKDLPFVVYQEGVDFQLLHMDEEGKVESVLDAGSVLEIYLGLCETGGHGRANVIGA